MLSRRQGRGGARASRTSSSRAACPTCSRAGSRSSRRAESTCTRSGSRSAWSRGSRRSTSRRWCRCGCSPTRSRAGTHSSSSRARRTRRRRCSSPTSGAGRDCPTACSRWCRERARRSTGCSTTPRSRRCRLSDRRRSRGTSTRPGRATASASRRWVARRTTWWSCPTPTSTLRPTRRCRPATAPPASAAWRSPRWWRSVTSASGSSRRSPRGFPRVKVGAGDDPTSEMGPLVTREHRDKVADLPRRPVAGRRPSGGRRARQHP